MEWLLLFLHLLLFHFPSFSSSSSSFNFLCHPDDSSALLRFKSSFTINTEYSGVPSPKTATWKNGTDCCSWLGVTCDTISGHVIGLNLGDEGLQGTIHPNSTLFRLARLQMLDLSWNNFSSSQLPSQFGGFVSLTHLTLSNCNFGKEIPPKISHLSKLVSLDLSFTGLIWKETTLKRLVHNATILRELFLGGTDVSLIRPDSMFSLLNQSSSLVTLSLYSTGLRGNLKNNILCLPSLQELYMSANVDLQGQLPKLSCSASLSILHLAACQFQGLIPPSFFNLTHLTSLSLSYNQLSGLIPSSLSHLQHLINLYLRSNRLGGLIPDVFGRLTKLQVLNLDFNKLEGQIPSSLFNMTQLVHLDCSHNKLEGPLPNKITGFSNLTRLILNNNLLNGTVPLWCLSLPSLVELDLSNNQFVGMLGHRTAISSNSLENLNLCSNKLQGNIPESIFNLVNLTFLCLSSNNLSGLVNFQIFSKLQNLEILSLSQNSQLSLNFESSVNDTFPSLTTLKLSSISLTEFPKFSGKFPGLSYLDLSNNKLHGRLPNWLLEMESLQFLNLSQNLVTSTDQFTRNYWLNLNSLDLSFNLLAGDISWSICNLSSLAMLILAHNKLTGTIPQCLANLSSLQVFDLQRNKLSGTLPSIFPEGNELWLLNLNDNQLEGLLPKSLSNCTYLEVLHLGNNHIEDTFPHWLQTLRYLKVLVLQGNKLHGPIASLKVKHPFPSLIIFDISSNKFSGPLPKAYIKKFEAMKNVIPAEEGSNLQYVGRNIQLDGKIFYVSVTMTIKGIYITFVKIPTIFVNVDLSRNKFEGEIPNVIGELHALKGLNLSHNRLTYPIPQSMGNLTNLESLDLSSNMLTGVIPAELANLNYLEVLNLSYNHLVGEIPQGKQFNTFSNDSYEGNLGLCGFPLSRKCKPEQHSRQAPIFWSEEKFGFGWKPVAIGYGCGMVFGMGLGCCVLLIGKPRCLVRMVGGQPNERVKRRTRMRRTQG